MSVLNDREIYRKIVDENHAPKQTPSVGLFSKSFKWLESRYGFSFYKMLNKHGLKKKNTPPRYQVHVVILKIYVSDMYIVCGPLHAL